MSIRRAGKRPQVAGETRRRGFGQRLRKLPNTAPWSPVQNSVPPALVLLAGGSFSPLDAEGALRAAIVRKTCEPCYELIKQGLDLLFLVVYYDRAVLKKMRPTWKSTLNWLARPQWVPGRADSTAASFLSTPTR